MHRISSLLLAAWFATAILFTPMLHTHGGEAGCPGACGSHSHGPAQKPAQGPSHDDCPACQFATSAALSPALGCDAVPAPLLIPDRTAPPADLPSATSCILLPPSCGPPRA
jgi:hypothetical protein